MTNDNAPMQRLLLPIPLAVLIAAGLGYGLLRIAGRAAHGREMIAAAVICLVAAELASVPAILARRSDPATASQAGLAGTVGHMFVALVLAGIAWMLKMAGERQPFLLWLLALYWASLVALVAVVVQVVRGAPVKPRGDAPGNPGAGQGTSSRPQA